MNTRKIENLLDKLQVKINTKGYRYWITAVEIYRKDPSIKKTKLYEMIAEKYNTTAVRAERALRHAHENNKMLVQRYFNVEYKIDNSAFLNLLVRELEREDEKEISI